jgi:hypothetical protein
MSSFSICFETDTEIISVNTKKRENKENKETILSELSATGTYINNKDAFTISNILNFKIRIIPDEIIDILQNENNINFRNIKLWNYDINCNLGNDFEKLVCIILFINGVYGIHYICNTDNYSITKQKQYILENILLNHKLYSQSNNEYVLLINTFNSDGRTKTSIYETI